MPNRPREEPTFYEFFAGGGMARAGLGADWRCLFANDFDAKKAASYAANWGAGEFRPGDIHRLRAQDLPGRADLAWASFPCQDLSLAGNGVGLSGARSGAFWGFHGLMAELRAQRREPRLLVLENVAGALTANKGADFQALCGALIALGYVVGALTLDAAHFLPQSRPRLFVIARRAESPAPARLVAAGPAPPFASAGLVRAHALLPDDMREAWRWWRLPAPPRGNRRLIDLIEEHPADVAWHSPAQTARLLSLMSPHNRAKLASAQAAGGRIAGALYRRTRKGPEGEKIQRAEIRFDGLAGCLRTPGGGSSRQFLVLAEGESLRSRLLSGREAARLMGLPESYVLPDNYNEAYHLLGDGLAVACVRFLAENLLRPLLEEAGAAEQAA